MHINLFNMCGIHRSKYMQCFSTRKKVPVLTITQVMVSAMILIIFTDVEVFQRHLCFSLSNIVLYPRNCIFCVIMTRDAREFWKKQKWEWNLPGLLICPVSGMQINPVNTMWIFNVNICTFANCPIWTEMNDVEQHDNINNCIINYIKPHHSELQAERQWKYHCILPWQIRMEIKVFSQP